MSAEFWTWPFGKTASALNFRGVPPALRPFKRRPVSDDASLLGHRNEKHGATFSSVFKKMSLKNYVLDYRIWYHLVFYKEDIRYNYIKN